MLAALLAVVFAVDLLLALQPALLDDLSHAWRSAVTMRPVLAPAANVLAAALAVACVVVSSALLLVFSRAAAVAPQLSVAPAWVALCMLSVFRVEGPLPLPLPMAMPLFAALSALLFVGASVALCSGSLPGVFCGWMLAAAPLVVLGAGYASSPHGAYAFGRDAGLFVAGLSLSAAGVVLLSFMRTRARRVREVPGLDGVDVVDELFTQIERAERSEARVAELERQLSAYTLRPVPAQRAPMRRKR
jgi:hypothetical protein